MEDQQVPPWAAALSAFALFAVACLLWFIGAEDCVDAGGGSIDLFGITCYVPAGSTYVPLGKRPWFMFAGALGVIAALSPAWGAALANRRRRTR